MLRSQRFLDTLHLVENGKMIVNHNKFMGYTKNENGELVIVPEEAEIVRLIFRLYLEGTVLKR